MTRIQNSTVTSWFQKVAVEEVLQLRHLQNQSCLSCGGGHRTIGGCLDMTDFSKAQWVQLLHQQVIILLDVQKGKLRSEEG
jgi:hypothetical protein